MLKDKPSTVKNLLPIMLTFALGQGEKLIHISDNYSDLYVWW